jgi:hypothetical protein
MAHGPDRPAGELVIFSFYLIPLCSGSSSSICPNVVENEKNTAPQTIQEQCTFHI